MEGIVAIIVQAIAGAVGGGLRGTSSRLPGWRCCRSSSPARSAAWPAARTSACSAAGGPGHRGDAAAAAGSLDVGQLLAQLIGGVGGGGILTAMVAQFMGKK